MSANGIGGESSMKMTRTNACTSCVFLNAGLESVAIVLGNLPQRLMRKRARIWATAAEYA